MARQPEEMTTSGAFATLWEFSVLPARQPEFVSHYGPDGSWVRLFRLAQGYLGTELLNDRTDPLRYVTIDRWQTAEHWHAFRRQFSAQYEALDRRCEGLTAREVPLGEYAAI
jgi:Antibiotic biosynthesis monooxygenase